MSCLVAGCARPILARGWCNAHYQRWVRNGTPQADIPIHGPRGGCHVADCPSPHYARGWCHKHYHRWLHHGTTDLIRWQPGPLVCTCLTPAPTPTDQRDRCKRVIANLIHKRRRREAEL